MSRDLANRLAYHGLNPPTCLILICLTVEPSIRAKRGRHSQTKKTERLKEISVMDELRIPVLHRLDMADWILRALDVPRSQLQGLRSISSARLQPVARATWLKSPLTELPADKDPSVPTG